MKKIVRLVLVLIFNMNIMFAYDIKVDTVSFIKSDQFFYEYIITIHNTDKEPLWIWLDDEIDKIEKDEGRKMRSHFFRSRGDFSIFAVATDPNMETHLWTESTSIEWFVKYLKPNHSFTIVICEDVTNEKTSDLTFSLDYVNIYSNQILRKNHIEMDEHYCVERISFPYDIFIYPLRKN